MAIMVAYVGMVYGPIGAFLAEYFLGRIRYTSVSLPYHIGNGWGGGLVPLITTAAYAGTSRLCVDLSNRRTCGSFHPWPVPDAGNTGAEHLGRASGPEALIETIK